MATVASALTVLLEQVEKTREESGVDMPEVSKGHIILLLVTLSHEAAAQIAWRELRQNMGVIKADIARRAIAKLKGKG